MFEYVLHHVLLYCTKCQQDILILHMPHYDDIGRCPNGTGRGKRKMKENMGTIAEALGGDSRINLEQFEGGMLHDVVYNRLFEIESANGLSVTATSVDTNKEVELPVFGTDGIRSGRYVVQPA